MSRLAGGPIGVLAIQGSFPLHLRSLERLGVSGRRVRKPEDLHGLSGLILPGGESTVMSLLMRQYGLFEPIRELGRGGLPMFGTCAGAILLGHGEGPPPRLELAPVELSRNAYGAQVDSFTAELKLKLSSAPFHGVFIRAPKIVRVGYEADGAAAASGGPTSRRPASGRPASGKIAPADVLGRHEDTPVLVEAGNFLLSTFHPELTDDLRVHGHFAALCAARKRL
jgi:5'-phosphate synthase pdxT subunit